MSSTNHMSSLLRSKYLPWLVLLLIWLASSWSLFQSGFFYLHDFVHAARAIEMLNALKDGQFPVRWSENFGYGFGMPLFQFYAPLPSYFGAFLLWLGIPTVLMLKVLWGVCSLVTLLGSYKLGKRLFPTQIALAVAAVFTLFPYRAVNLFVRGALSEAWGMMWMPWMVLAVVGILKKQKWSWVGLVVSTAGLMLSHNLSTLMFVPLLGLLSLLFAAVTNNSLKEKAKAVFDVFTGLVVAGGVSAFYMLPAVGEKQYTQVDSILSGYFSPIHHFLYIRQFIKPFWGYGGSEWGPNDGISFFWGFGQWLGLVLAGCGLLFALWSWWRAKNTKEKEDSALSSYLVPFVVGLILIGVGSFFSLARSQWLWDKIAILSYIQFPWRWLSVVNVGISLVVGAGLSLLPRNKVGLLATAAVILTTVSTSWYYFRPESPLLSPDDYYYTDATRIRSTMSSILPDYMPVGLGKVTTPPESLVVVPLGLDTQVETVVDDGHQKLFKTTFTSPATLNVAIASYPGWYAEIDGQATAVKDGSWQGSMAVEVPAGEHLVGFKLGETPIRWWSDAISLVSVLVVFGVSVRNSMGEVQGQQSVVKSTVTKSVKKTSKRKKK